MRYHALATDYDGTIANHSTVSDSTIAALHRLKRSGRSLILVTGRELPDLMNVFPHPEIFDRIVAENGALLYRPDTQEQRPLGEGPAHGFADRLREQGVSPLSIGRVIVATTEPNETQVLEAIRDLGLELQVIFNKGAVMVLPSGINKATGLTAALKELGLSSHNVVGIGDAENDHAFLRYCECSAAVANALPSLKECADIVTRSDHGDGVAELVDHLVADDLQAYGARLTRHDISLGVDGEGRSFRVNPYGTKLLVVGDAGLEQSSVTTGFIQALFGKCYQTCIIDPDGDYATLEEAVVLGDRNRPPGVEAVIKALEQPQTNVVVNLAAVKQAERPIFLQRLLLELSALRARTSRPHWIVIDEAHQVLPTSWPGGEGGTAPELSSTMYVTAHPNRIAPVVLPSITCVISSGSAAHETLREFCAAAGRERPGVEGVSPEQHRTLGWRVGEARAFPFTPLGLASEHYKVAA
jgi:HAD superfamily hydrolase (TIGR01484 family)